MFVVAQLSSAQCPMLYLPKVPENFWFSRGYKIGTLATNGSITRDCIVFPFILDIKFLKLIMYLYVVLVETWTAFWEVLSVNLPKLIL